MDISEHVKVTCLPNARKVASEWRAKLVCSLLDAGLPAGNHPRIATGSHVIALMDDRERADATTDFDKKLAPMMDIIAEHVSLPAPRLLFHCHAGVSRSTAAAYGAIAMLVGKGRETEAFGELLKITHKPWPNRRVVEVFDDFLGLGGALLEPLDDMRARFPMRLEHYRRFNRRRGIISKYQR